MGLTQKEFEILSSRDVNEGFYESSPFRRTNKEIVDKLVKRGLIERDNNDGWSENSYNLTSKGRLELNLYGKERKK